MRFETKKFSLQAVLEKAASVLPTRDVVPVLKNFYIEVSKGADGEADLLRVMATDLELSVIAETELVSVDEPGDGVFPGKRLLEIVKEAEDGTVVLNVTEREATISVGRSQWTLMLNSGEEYPPIPNAAGMAFKQVPRNRVVEGLSMVRYAAARESIRSTLMMIDVSDGRMRAADGARFQQVAVADMPDMQIPINAVDDLVKLLRGSETTEIGLAEDEDHLVFKVGNDIFVCNKMVSEFPNVDEVLLKPALANDREVHVDRDELIGAIKRARITADEDSNAMSVLLEDNAMTITARDKQHNFATVTIDCAWSGGRHEIGLNHRHFMEMLMMAPGKDCHFYLGNDTKTRKSPVLLRDEEAGLLAVLNQIRLDWVS